MLRPINHLLLITFIVFMHYCFDYAGDVQRDSLADLIKGSPLVKIKNAAATALAAAAVKAKVLADQEEWEILRLTAFVVDSQVMNYQYDIIMGKTLKYPLLFFISLKFPGQALKERKGLNSRVIIEWHV